MHMCMVKRKAQSKAENSEAQSVFIPALGISSSIIINYICILSVEYEMSLLSWYALLE